MGSFPRKLAEQVFQRIAGLQAALVRAEKRLTETQAELLEQQGRVQE